MKNNSQRCVTYLSDEQHEKVNAFAQQSGLTVSSAIATLVERGLDGGLTKDELDRALEKNLAATTELLADRTKTFEQGAREIQIARKNIGKTARASFGTFSLLVWIFQDLMRFFEKAGATDERIKVWGRMPKDKIFKFFESSGGSLQADGQTRYFPSFKTAMNKPPFNTIAPEDITGYDKEKWERLTGQSNDAAAVRSLGDKKQHNPKENN